jgi:hypothetical protein
MPYKKLEQGIDTVFEVAPEMAPSMGWGIMAGAKMVNNISLSFISLICVLVGAAFGKIGLIIGMVVGGTIYWTNTLKRKPESLLTKDRTASRFTVNPEGINFNGQFYKKKDIHRIVIRNEVSERMGDTIIAVSDGSAASRNYAAGARRGADFNRRLAAVSHKVEFESGGVPHVLAGGLTEAAAFAIQSDVGAILGLT